VNLEEFTRQGRDRWRELERALARAGAKPERLGPEGVVALGRLYRSSVADLALARRRFPGDPIVARLEDLVARGRSAVYDSEPRRARLWSFLAQGYWRRVREAPWALAVSFGLLGAAILVGWVWAQQDPGAAIGVVPGSFRSSGPPGQHTLNLSVDQSAAISAGIFTNNIQVTFLAFAGGVAAGLLTAGLLLYNGLLLGVLGSLTGQVGEGRLFLDLVVPHGVLELSCIGVAAAAGMRLGAALVAPGLVPRGVALRRAAVPAVEVVLGTIPWLVVAGLVEGFVTPTRLPLGAAIALGVGLAAVYWTLVAWRGRAPGDRAPGDRAHADRAQGDRPPGPRATRPLVTDGRGAWPAGSRARTRRPGSPAAPR